MWRNKMIDKSGVVIWELGQGNIPKEIFRDVGFDGDIDFEELLDVENKTYVIRIGKEALR